MLTELKACYSPQDLIFIVSLFILAMVSSPLGFKFTLQRSPNLNFFVTDANIPSMSLGFIELPTPFKIIELPGDKIDFGDLQITFRVDEDFENYFEIYNWIIALGFPDEFGQYKNIKDAVRGSKETIVSDATLTIMNSAMDPNVEVRFQDLFPVTIGDINFTTSDTDVNYVTNTVTFKYKKFTVVKI